MPQPPQPAEARQPAGAPGELIGKGRSADVYALDSGLVLRRYRTSQSAEAEAALMTFLFQAGYPVPEVVRADGGDLIMQRLDGRDMLADLLSRPWRVLRHASMLASLHDRLHAITAPPGLPHPFGDGDCVMHLDLHPGNVMLTSHGPAVIDWSNVAAGPAGADVAMAYLIMASSDVDLIPMALRPVVGGLRASLLRQFLAETHDDPKPYIPSAAAARMRDPNVRPSEVDRLRRMAEQAAVDPQPLA
jgi:tRNA A-37 threonylcarbamoyl transferase component Bud32